MTKIISAFQFKNNEYGYFCESGLYKNKMIGIDSNGVEHYLMECGYRCSNGFLKINNENDWVVIDNCGAMIVSNENFKKYFLKIN